LRIGHRRIDRASATKPAAGTVAAVEFHDSLLNAAVIGPFQEALLPHGHRVSRMACEKLIHFPNGAPQDAKCWLIVTKN
jgi:hypothetical protein